MAVPGDRGVLAGLGARPCGGQGKFSFPKWLVEPVAERQDEFPSRGDGGSECRTPAHRSRDGERSSGSGTWEGSGQEWGRRTRGPGGHLPRPTVGRGSTCRLPFCLPSPETPELFPYAPSAAPHRGGPALRTAAARGWSVGGTAGKRSIQGRGGTTYLTRPSRPRASPSLLFAGVSTGREEPEVLAPSLEVWNGELGKTGFKTQLLKRACG